MKLKDSALTLSTLINTTDMTQLRIHLKRSREEFSNFLKQEGWKIINSDRLLQIEKKISKSTLNLLFQIKPRIFEENQDFFFGSVDAQLVKGDDEVEKELAADRKMRKLVVYDFHNYMVGSLVVNQSQAVFYSTVYEGIIRLDNVKCFGTTSIETLISDKEKIDNYKLGDEVYLKNALKEHLELYGVDHDFVRVIQSVIHQEYKLGEINALDTLKSIILN